MSDMKRVILAALFCLAAAASTEVTQQEITSLADLEPLCAHSVEVVELQSKLDQTQRQLEAIQSLDPITKQRILNHVEAARACKSTRHGKCLATTKGSSLGEAIKGPAIKKKRISTKRPTRKPTKRPTRKPTKRPTRKQTKRPTRKQTKRPTSTSQASSTVPMKKPDSSGKNSRTVAGLSSTTRQPTKSPTEKPPTKRPTKKPTKPPTAAPCRNCSPTWRCALEYYCCPRKGIYCTSMNMIVSEAQDETSDKATCFEHAANFHKNCESTLPTTAVFRSDHEVGCPLGEEANEADKQDKEADPSRLGEVNDPSLEELMKMRMMKMRMMTEATERKAEQEAEREKAERGKCERKTTGAKDCTVTSWSKWGQCSRARKGAELLQLRYRLVRPGGSESILELPDPDGACSPSKIPPIEERTCASCNVMPPIPPGLVGSLSACSASVTVGHTDRADRGGCIQWTLSKPKSVNSSILVEVPIERCLSCHASDTLIPLSTMLYGVHSGRTVGFCLKSPAWPDDMQGSSDVSLTYGHTQRVASIEYIPVPEEVTPADLDIIEPAQKPPSAASPLPAAPPRRDENSNSRTSNKGRRNSYAILGEGMTTGSLQRQLERLTIAEKAAAAEKAATTSKGHTVTACDIMEPAEKPVVEQDYAPSNRKVAPTPEPTRADKNFNPYATPAEKQLPEKQLANPGRLGELNSPQSPTKKTCDVTTEDGSELRAVVTYEINEMDVRTRPYSIIEFRIMTAASCTEQPDLESKQEPKNETEHMLTAVNLDTDPSRNQTKDNSGNKSRNQTNHNEIKANNNTDNSKKSLNKDKELNDFRALAKTHLQNKEKFESPTECQALYDKTACKPSGREVEEQEGELSATPANDYQRGQELGATKADDEGHAASSSESAMESLMSQTDVPNDELEIFLKKYGCPENLFNTAPVCEGKGTQDGFVKAPIVTICKTTVVKIVKMTACLPRDMQGLTKTCFATKRTHSCYSIKGVNNGIVDEKEAIELATGQSRVDCSADLDSQAMVSIV